MAHTSNESAELDKHVQWLNAATVGYYGPIICNYILTGKYKWLQDYLIIPPSLMQNSDEAANAIRKFHSNSGYAWGRVSKSKHDLTPTWKRSGPRTQFHSYPRDFWYAGEGFVELSSKGTKDIAEGAFEAYLVYMSKHKFYYVSTQGAPEGSMFNDTAIAERHAYEIFFDPKAPSGNCTVVNQGFLTLLQFLGFHPSRLALRRVGGDRRRGESEAFVITRNAEKLRVLEENGIIDARYKPFLNLPSYVSNALRLLDLECKIGKSDYETPFPNHQFAEIIGVPGVYRFWDARNGLRYANPMGIFEFWETRGEIRYKKGQEQLRAKVVWGDDPRELTVEASAHCHKSVVSVTKRPIMAGERDAAWFYINGDKPYGAATTSVSWSGPGPLALPHLVASSYGYFIPDAQLNTIHARLRKGLDDYEGRWFAKRSEESQALAGTLRSIVGGGKKSAAITSSVPKDQLRDIIYGLLGSTQPVEGYPPMRREGKLFETLADAFAMPKVLRA